MNLKTSSTKAGRAGSIRGLLAIAAGIGALFGSQLNLTAVVPVVGQLVPVAVYHDLDHPFGLAYDSANNLIWYTRGDTGDARVHSLKPFKSFTSGELSALPVIGGVFQVSPTASQNDVAGTTTVAGTGAEGFAGAHFGSLAYDQNTGQLVAQGNGFILRSFDPFTGSNMIANYHPGSAIDSFSDGLDVDGTNVWFSPDVDNIFRNGALVISAANPSQSTLAGWTGLGTTHTLGWSGCEQVGKNIYAVAVHSGGDTGRSRTIVRFDADTFALAGYDPDGDPVAARWEDLAFDGRYLYAADLRGNANTNAIIGDVYVFDVTGGLSPESDIELTPKVATNQVGTAHTVCASVTGTVGGLTNQPQVGVTVTFTVTNGPNAGVTGTGITDTNGVCCFTYVDSGGAGTDIIDASFVDASGRRQSTFATKIWMSSGNQPPVAICTNVVVSAGSNCVANASIDNGSYDPDGTNVFLTQVPPGPYPIGSNNVCLIVTDSQGASNACCAVVQVVDTTPPTINCPGAITATNDPGQCSAVVSGFVISATDCAIASLTADYPTNLVFPVGTTTVTATAVDTAGNTNTCSFTVTVLDGEAPVASCRAASNPSAKKIPVAGKDPKSGQNPDGYYQLLGKDNCDPNCRLFLHDTASGFIAGPFNSGDIIKLRQSPGGTPSSTPDVPPIAAQVRLNGDGALYAVDASGNISQPAYCLVPPPPK
jgi:hypothetical protein